ncbi:hypothetical protein GII33_13990 [Gordonia pseudamarae]|uniref:DNA polymerase I n=1 Tax=Gordonia pseudamarae TaxID=2831662 RepID=A0ABX6IKM2_9ACTN|nr:hypothetical protein GII33_13990 [Gordonia pseudamarae]QHN35788.1 hypothetical protein GII31_13815 [Gordonia pseudamarae]
MEPDLKPLSLHNADVYAYPTGDDLSEAVVLLRADLAAHPRERAAVDIETNALDLGDPREAVRTIQLGTSRVILVLDASDANALDAAADLLNDEAVRWTAHNAAYDTVRLARVGVIDSLPSIWDRMADTYILTSLIEPPTSDLGYRDLKSQTRAWCGASAVSADAKADLDAAFAAHKWKGLSQQWKVYDNPDPTAGDNGWAQIDLADIAFIAYAAADIADSARLVAVLEPIARLALGEVVDTEHRVARIAAEMTLRGVRLDRDFTVARRDDCQRGKDAALAEMRAAGFTGIPSRAADIVTFLDGEAMPPHFTDKGGRSTGSVTLAEYAALGSRLAEPLLAWRTADKLLKTYFTRYLRSGGERIHPTVDTIKARTGRMSSSDPNFQNLPSRSAAAQVRECFIADPGMAFISADFSSIEMRVAAAITRDPGLLPLYTAPLAGGEDPRTRCPYWLMAWDLHGPQASKADRGAVKSVVLGRMYGGAGEALAEQAGLPLDAVNAALDAYGRMYPALSTWARETLTPQTTDLGRPIWRLPSGRIQAIDPGDAWKALNVVIQGLSRDVLVHAILRCEDAGLGQYLVMPIHDELLLQVPEDRAEELLDRLVETMRSEVMGVPIPAEGSLLGPRWVAKD